MKNFFISFLGTIAGIWASIIIFCILSVIFMIGIAAMSAVTSPDAGKIQKNSILHVNLDGTVVDRTTPVSLVDQIYGQMEKSIPLDEMVNAIENAATDKNVNAIYLECNGGMAGMAQSQAIITALRHFKESGKKIYAYSDNYIQENYILATMADSLYLNPIGMVDIHGLSTTVLYFKDLIEKLDLDVQVVKVGTYKSAVEPYLLNSMSEANREQTVCFMDNMWNSIKKTIAENRSVDTAAVTTWANSFTFTQQPETYVENHIVDRLLYRHQMDSILRVVSGVDSDDDPRLVTPSEYLTARNITTIKKGKGKNKIAVLYAVGEIVDEGSTGIVGEKYVSQIMDLADEDDICGLVMRVNSPGGSAFASEQIWEALEQYKKITGNPYYVSMGDYAASGGYYISCGADKIFAEDLTLTGSIGIFGVIPSIGRMMKDKLGVNASTVSTNTGLPPTFLDPMTPQQRAAMQSYVDNGYELFVQRCAQGRSMTVDAIKAIAEGRVWDGRKAQELGLVDTLGGLDMAINEMADSLQISDNYRVVTFPKVKFQWWEEIMMANVRIRESVMRSALGEMAPMYDAAIRMRQTAPLQCRMEYLNVR